MKDLLLVIDVQNVYFPKQPWACPSLPAAWKNIQRLLDSPSCGHAYDVVFTQYLAPKEPKGRWNQYNQEYRDINADPYLSKLAGPLTPYLEKWPVYVKSTYSSCSIPELRTIPGQYDRILLTGVVAECCILSTMMSFIDEGAHVCYLKDAIAGQSPEWEARIEAIAASFSPVHTEVLGTDEYLHRHHSS